jgi:hypothetical protein
MDLEGETFERRHNDQGWIMGTTVDPEDYVFHAVVEGLNGKTARGTKRLDVFRRLREDDPLLLVLDDRDGKGRASRVLVYTLDGEDIGHVESEFARGAARGLKRLAVYEVTVLDTTPSHGEDELVIDAVAIAASDSRTSRDDRKAAKQILKRYASIDHPWAKWRSTAPLPEQKSQGGFCGCVMLLAAALGIAMYFVLR